MRAVAGGSLGFYRRRYANREEGARAFARLRRGENANDPCRTRIAYVRTDSPAAARAGRPIFRSASRGHPFRRCSYVSWLQTLTFAVAAALAGLAAGTANAEAPLDGALDSTFADNGSATIPFDLLPTGPIDTALDTVVDSFGRVYLVGTVFTASGSRIGIMRLRKDGTPDTTYGLDGNGKVTGPDGTGFDLSGVSAALDADNNLLVGGTRSIGGNYDFAVCKFTLGGTATTFPNGLHCVAVAFDLGGDNKDTLRDIAVQPNGKIVMVGSASTGQGKTAGAVARLDAEGTSTTTLPPASMSPAK